MFISLSLFVGIYVHIRTVLLHIYHMYTCMYKCHSASSKYIHYCICQILQKNQLNMYIFKYVYNKSIYIRVITGLHTYIYTCKNMEKICLCICTYYVSIHINSIIITVSSSRMEYYICLHICQYIYVSIEIYLCVCPYVCVQHGSMCI